MTNRYHCDDKERLVAFLYGETSDRERAEVEAHLAGCVTCAEEVDELRAVRVDLAAWQPPEADLGFRIVREPVTTSRRWWQCRRGRRGDGGRMLLALAASVQVEYGNGASSSARDGPRPSAPPAGAAGGQPRRRRHDAGEPSDGSTAMSEADVRAALASLESRLRAEMATSRMASATSAPATGGAGFDRVALVKQVEGLIDASERRQQRELAFRLAQAMQDVDTQRRSDMVRIENGLGQIEGLTGQEVARQSRLINYLMRTSQEN